MADEHDSANAPLPLPLSDHISLEPLFDEQTVDEANELDFLSFGADLDLPSTRSIGTASNKRRKVTVQQARVRPSAEQVVRQLSSLSSDPPSRGALRVQDFEGVLDPSELQSLEELLTANLEEMETTTAASSSSSSANGGKPSEVEARREYDDCGVA